MSLDPAFAIRSDELLLAYEHAAPRRQLSFDAAAAGDGTAWRTACLAKLGELLRVSQPEPGSARELRRTVADGVALRALVMPVGSQLTLPAYLLEPADGVISRSTVIAIHGHGEAEACIGVREDYHHGFARLLARRGHRVLCPALRGFGTLAELSRDITGNRLEYWNWQHQHKAYSLITDSFLYGDALLGETTMDLLRWEDWLCRATGSSAVDVAGISYGGDLALLYPVFSQRVRRIFASGTLGSFTAIFKCCYNAPAHCIPGILEWMDRSDIAGLNAPRAIALHYGQRDVPGPENGSAAYNQTVAPALAELEAIYRSHPGAPAPRLIVSQGLGHEMDCEALSAFLGER